MRILARVTIAGLVVLALLPTGAARAAAEDGHGPSACPSAFNPPAPFADRAGISDAHIRNVDCAYNHGVVRGLAGGSYGPRSAVRRDQLAGFLARMLQAAGHELPAPSDQGFADIATSVHRDAINRLARIGVITGTGAGDTYRPGQPVRRDQMAALLVRAAAWTTATDVEELYADADATPFTDLSGELVHRAAVAGAFELGLTHGRTASTYDPAGTVARQQMASFVVRAFAAFLDGTPAEVDAAGFRGAARPLPAALAARMDGVSWRPGCPVALDDLALLEMTHRGFDGQARVGEMVVAARLADDVLTAFARIYDAGFPIERMRLVDDYGGSDDRSMADNNTSAFNCRAITGGSRFSEHAYGRAIDINPVQNPYVRDGDVQPPAGAEYRDRRDVRGGMIARPGPVTDAFDAIGWGWGGDWRTLADYMHVSETGR